MKHLQPIEISQVSVFNSTRAVVELFWKLQHLSFVMKLERRDDSPSGENAGTEFTLRWHEGKLADAMTRAWEEKLFLDVTLASGHGTNGAHRLVLCACSDFLENLLTSSNLHPNPMLYLNDIDFEDLVALVEFMYRGRMTVTHQALPGIINGAKILKIRGLSREMEELVSSPPESSGSSEPPVVDRDDNRSSEQEGRGMDKTPWPKRKTPLKQQSLQQLSPRLRISWGSAQLALLEKFYLRGKHPTPEQCQVYANQLSQVSQSDQSRKSQTSISVTGNHVITWFQNRRHKDTPESLLRRRNRSGPVDFLTGPQQQRPQPVNPAPDQDELLEVVLHCRSELLHLNRLPGADENLVNLYLKM